jgi:hypothetical protein
MNMLLRPAALLSLTLAACGGGMPARYVIERDLGPYHYRRYQETLDAELPVAGNRAHGHTAAYMQRQRQHVEVITAFVTVYEKPERLTEALRTELAALPGYELKTDELAGQFVWRLDSSSEASFWIWPSGHCVVKLGAAAGQRVPEAIAEPYAGLYPSDLDKFGHAREGAASGGSVPETDEVTEPAEPAAKGALAGAKASR